MFITMLCKLVLHSFLDGLSDRWWIFFRGWNQVWRHFKSNSEPSLVNNEDNTIFAWKLFHKEDTVNHSFIVLKSINDLRYISHFTDTLRCLQNEFKWTVLRNLEWSTTEVNKKNQHFLLSVHLVSNHLLTE